MKAEDYSFVCAMLKEKSGLLLSDDKAYLLENRLMPVARKRMMNSLEDLIKALRTGRDDELVTEVVEAMTTNESFFFRDIKPFEQFRRIVLPQLMEARAATKKIRIWSAACATGQEPYTLGMILLEESAKLNGWAIEILATDICTQSLGRARSGAYSQFEVQRGLPAPMLVKHFDQKENQWQISEQLRSMIEFSYFNLLTDMRAVGQIDVVFCRNVLIYFDQETKKSVLERISQLLPRDGVLFLGGAETVLGVCDRFTPVKDLTGGYRLASHSATSTPSPDGMSPGTSADANVGQVAV